METIVFKSIEEVEASKIDVIQKFKDYTAKCVEGGFEVRYTNCFGSDENLEGVSVSWSPEIKKGVTQTVKYTAEGRSVREHFLHEIVFPIVEYALEVESVFNLRKRSTVRGSGEEHVVLYPRGASGARTTSYFG